MRNRFHTMALVLAAAIVLPAFAHPDHADHAELVLGEWTFAPDYRLPRGADVSRGPRPMAPESPRFPFAYDAAPVRFAGLEATDRVTHLLGPEDLPTGAFSVELWVTDHVNQPVGALLAAKGAGAADDVAWSLGYLDGRAVMSAGTGRGRVVIDADTEKLRHRGYWRHIVGVYDGGEMVLWVNGERAAAGTGPAEIVYAEGAQLEMAAYTEHEPFMEIGNLVWSARVVGEAMGADDVGHRFAHLAGLVEEGVLFPGVFHFTAPPYLNMTTRSSTNLVFETDRASTASVRYGVSHDFDRTLTIDDAARLHTVTLDGLEPATRYFYQVTVEDGAGRSVTAGPFAFKTAARAGEAIGFAVIGDTEARPHINNRVAQLVWDERPDFVINCGDLTDGGKRNDRWQWTHEYFLGVGHLHAWVPSFPVPGNGEADLVWYNHYHDLPEPEAYYSFRWGDAAFFMLDSNQSGSGFAPGGEQYEWLKAELAASDATWKFVAHHHPVYTSDENDYGDTWKGEASDNGDVRVRRIAELYEEFGVDAVFFGHLHTYERSWPVLRGEVNPGEGVVYIQAGGAGGNLEDFQPTRTFFKHKSFRGHHYCTVNIVGPVMEFRMYDLDGALRDSLTVRKDEMGTRTDLSSAGAGE